MKKVLLVLLSLLFLVGLTGCDASKPKTTNTAITSDDLVNIHIDENGTYWPTEMYENNSFVVMTNYKGLDMTGLDGMNVIYGSEAAGSANVGGGCSITFADYFNGVTGAIRNMDLQLSKYCAYEMIVRPGDNVKYPFWGLAYTGMDSKSYYEVLETGLEKDRYNQLPFTTTDTMSFGYDDKGDRASLYCAVLMRSSETDENGNYIWSCSGTYPGAKYRCATQSVPTLIAAQCISIDEALAYVGAVDENYNRIFPSIEPSLDVYTFNIETETMSNHWFEVVAMEDSTGRHGVLEFIENRAIWHEGIDYSFNFFLQDEYLYNEDGSFREQHGAGLGRYKAVVPYLDTVNTMEDHLSLMNSISYSHMTYYNEDNGYIGRDYEGNPIDWRSEFTGADVWAGYNKFKNILKLDVSVADSKYTLWSNYLDTNTNEIVRIDSLEDYLANQSHLKSIYDMNYVEDDKNYDEVMNYLRWCGTFYGSLSEEDARKTNSAWETYFRVIADPMNFRVTRWFNEVVSTCDTYTWSDMVGVDSLLEENSK